MAWWLVDSIMNGTLEEDYPIKGRPRITSSYYDENGAAHLRQDYGDLNTKVHGLIGKVKEHISMPSLIHVHTFLNQGKWI